MNKDHLLYIAIWIMTCFTWFWFVWKGGAEWSVENFCDFLCPFHKLQPDKIVKATKWLKCYMHFAVIAVTIIVIAVLFN